MEDATVLVVGCGPVGLCSLVALASFKPKRVFAVDSIASRLAIAKGLGAEVFELKDEALLKKKVVAKYWR